MLNLLFLTLYTLVKKNLCEYNIKEAISVAQKAQDLGNLQYPEQKQELENILKDIQECHRNSIGRAHNNAHSPYNTVSVIHAKTLAINLEASLLMVPAVLLM